MKPWKWGLAATFLLAAILVPFVFYGEAIESWARGFIEGARGRPLVSAAVLGGLLAGDILLPTPSSLVSTACGLLLGFLPGLTVSFAGMTVGSFAGYAIGRWGGRRLLDRLVGGKDVARFDSWSSRFGDWSVVACRPVPVLAEASVVIAGTARMPAGRFALMVSLSNLAVSAVYSAAGAWSAQLNSFLIAFALSIALPGAIKLLLSKRQ
jgi:membrane protein DedA with SNARE-associated domain